MNKIRKENFPSRLRKIMNDRNISQAQLSKITNITASSISDWLNGKYEAKQDKIDMIATCLNISPAWLMGYDVNIERTIDKNDDPQQSNLNEDEEKLLTNFNNSNTEGKKIILNTSETISKAYPRALENNIITREEMLEYFKGKSFAAFSGVGLNQMSDENLRNIYDLVKNAEE